MNNNHLFDSIKKKTGVKMEDILGLARTFQNADFRDRDTVRKVVREVARVANRPVSQEKEDRIVETIVSGKGPKDLSSLASMLKK
ncbi:stage VI sporulation protein F [Shouchella shacheensis]|uniref:stage VI sporulation protein F n=1 Tax=Shouchella shacheensis TaxID=1649580 RepID=UPI00073FE411|nr:stage VI sporulation protein F [Shouchella shacheensis]